MASWVRKELAKFKFYKTSTRLLLPPPPSLNLQLSPDESSTISQVQQVVLAADLTCTTCQRRVADAISSIDDFESMVVHVLEKKMILTARKSAATILPQKKLLSAVQQSCR